MYENLFNKAEKKKIDFTMLPMFQILYISLYICEEPTGKRSHCCKNFMHGFNVIPWDFYVESLKMSHF